MIALLVALAISLPVKRDIKITSYNPSVHQTDASPCVGASLRNLCTAAKEGDRTVALSRDLLWRWGGEFRWRDKVKITSDNPQCNGVYSLEDTMAKRFKARAEIFFMDRKKNTSCNGTIEKLQSSR